MKIQIREGNWSRLMAQGAKILSATVALFYLAACADNYAAYPANRYYASRYANSDGPYYGPYANRPVGYGPPLYSVYPYNNYDYRPYPNYGYGNGVGVTVGRGYDGRNYYPGGYGYRGERVGKRKHGKKLRRQSRRNYEVDPAVQSGIYQR